MTIQPAYITPELLRWARERAHLSTKQVADKSLVKPAQLVSWESGEERPTLRQAQKLAQVLHVPFGYFFLSSPPVERPALPDLRTVPVNKRNSFSTDFLDLLNDVLRKQQWYREFLEAESAERLPFIAKFRIGDDVNRVAEDIRRTLEIDYNFRRQVPSWEVFLTEFIRQAEGLRILVMRSGIVKNETRRKLSVDEFRGFVINDVFAPLIFLNGKDAKAAQIFTLAHELAHLWIGESGISNLNLRSRDLTQNHQVERMCNQIAAEVLVPQQSFLVEWQANQKIQDNVVRLVRHYRVSSLVVLRRAFDLQRISWHHYVEHYRNEEERFRARVSSQQPHGGNFYANLETRNSKQLTRAALSAAFEGRLLYRDAARLLGVKVDKLEKVATVLGIR